MLFLQLSCLLFAARAASRSDATWSPGGAASSSVPSDPRHVPLGPQDVRRGRRMEEAAAAAVRSRPCDPEGPSQETELVPAEPLLSRRMLTAHPREGGWVRMADGKWEKLLQETKEEADTFHFLAACHLPLEMRHCVAKFVLNTPDNVADAWRVGMEEAGYNLPLRDDGRIDLNWASRDDIWRAYGIPLTCAELVPPGMRLDADPEFANTKITYGKPVPGSTIYRPPPPPVSASTAGKGKGGGKAGKGAGGKGGKGKFPPAPAGWFKGKGKGPQHLPIGHSFAINEEDIREPAPLLTAHAWDLRCSEDAVGLWYEQLSAFSHEGYLWCPRRCGCGIRFTPDGVNRFRKHLASCRADVESVAPEEDLWYEQFPAFSHEGYLWCPRRCGCSIRFTPDGVNRFREHLAFCRADVDVESVVPQQNRQTLQQSFAPVVAELARESVRRDAGGV